MQKCQIYILLWFCLKNLLTYPWKSVAHWVFVLPLFLLWQSVIAKDIHTIGRESVVEENIGQPELDEDNDPVAGFHQDEAPEVNVVLVMNVLGEELHQDILSLLLVFHESRGGPLPEKLHEAALHHEPAHPGEVEHEGEEDEVKRHPLHNTNVEI